jgi:hypothetical protein
MIHLNRERIVRDNFRASLIASEIRIAGAYRWMEIRTAVFTDALREIALWAAVAGRFRLADVSLHFDGEGQVLNQ